jgi:membrane peptidoglycan carboxypeptidase
VASGGSYCTPLPVSAGTDRQGHRMAIGPQCHRVLDPDIANAAADAARCPVGQQSAYHRCNGGTARQVAALFGGRPVAGKTGSTEDNTTETFVGFTPTLAAAGTAADAADPRDRVGSAVESRVVDAVARTLRPSVAARPIWASHRPPARSPSDAPADLSAILELWLERIGPETA